MPIHANEENSSRRSHLKVSLDRVKSLLSQSNDTPNSSNKKMTVMVSSTVYGIEPLLDDIYQILSDLGYEVWMSHKGTLPVFSTQSAFENCIEAVRQADLFFCIITPQYGSGKSKESLSITHKELLSAIDQKKLRWVIAHDHVIFSRSLLRNLGYKTTKDRANLNLRSNNMLGDLRVIDMYEAAILDSKALQNRQGNWVQKYDDFDDVTLYVHSQFKNKTHIRSLLQNGK
ncbi:DUF4062 domain-containing protein [bacterium]|nr:DUF4062 domain-containing protein [bacterium]